MLYLIHAPQAARQVVQAIEGCNLAHAQPVEAPHESLQHPGAVKTPPHPKL